MEFAVSTTSSSNLLLCYGVSQLAFLTHAKGVRRTICTGTTKKWRALSSPRAVSVDHNPTTASPPLPTTTEQSVLKQDEGRGGEDQKFDWNLEWYPVAVPDELDKRIPNPVRVLGKDLVVWWDRNGGTWQVWDDKCPHRLVPLSEGRIDERGQLQCSYHGWSFAACSGSCTRIPQAPVDGPPVCPTPLISFYLTNE
jgi:nitrite reductase/ring-hydroxylating ferredoxin subunit